MRKFFCIVLVVSMLMFNVFYANALTEGDWEYKILNNEIVITNYNGSDKHVVVPDTIRGCPVVVVERVYSTNIESIHLPETVREIGHEYEFASGNLKSINIPKNLKVINKMTFLRLGNLKGTLDLSNVEKIGKWSFSGCSAEIILSNKLTEIPEGAFTGISCPIDIPNSVQSIDKESFINNKLKTITVPGNVKTIGPGAFARSKTLKTVILSYGVETLSRGHIMIDVPIFSYCPSLESIYIPDTVTTLSSDLIKESENAIIYCSENSYAADFCKKNGLSYIIDNSVNSKIHVLYNDERISFHKYNQNPEIVNGRTLVPLRSIFEAIGATVEWDDSTQTVTAKKDKTIVSLQIGSAQMNVNGTVKTLDVPATLMNGRTMVPVRAISEAFGCTVGWSDNTQTVTLTDL